jgi:hypothetical protein
MFLDDRLLKSLTKMFSDSSLSKHRYTYQMKSIAFILSQILFLIVPCNAAITFNIDSIAKTITFTGEDTGTPYEDMLSNYAYWQSGTTSGSPEQLAITAGFSGDDFVYSGLVIYPSSPDGLFIEVSWITSSEKTFTGSNTPISYASLSSASQSILEATTSMTLQSGTGFSSLNAVPEPTSALIGALGAIILLRRRRI